VNDLNSHNDFIMTTGPSTLSCILSSSSSSSLVIPRNVIHQRTITHSSAELNGPCLNSFGNRTSPSDNSNDRWKRLCLVSWAAVPCVWTLRALTRNLLTYLFTYRWHKVTVNKRSHVKHWTVTHVTATFNPTEPHSVVTTYPDLPAHYYHLRGRVVKGVWRCFLLHMSVYNALTFESHD